MFPVEIRTTAERGRSDAKWEVKQLNADRDETESRKALALELILDAWEAGLEEGIEPEILASSAVFAALTDMIENHGEEFVAQMCQSLPSRVRSGEFTLTHEVAQKVKT